MVERNLDRSVELDGEPDPSETASLPSLTAQGADGDSEPREDSGDSEPLSQVQSSRAGFKSLLFDILETLLLTIVIYAVLSVFIGRYKVLSVSMEPTLIEGQYLLISKQTHKIWPLERGDIIVFQYPRNPQKSYIKRIIGLPGEKVELQNGELYINDELIPEPWLSRQSRASSKPWQLGEDEYFVMGDNRSNSSDSRAWGPLKSPQIIGKAVFRYWPLQSFGLVQHGPKPTAAPTATMSFESILTSPLPAGSSP